MAVLVYDFARDGGAIADVVKLGTVGGKLLVLNSYIHVEEDFTSGGDAVVAIGIEGDAVGAFLSEESGILDNLVDDAVLLETSGQGLVLLPGDEIHLSVADAALTAGKVNVVLIYMNIR